MRYIQYFTKSAMDDTKLVETCGNRGVIIIDGRWRISRAIEEAIECNGKRRPFYEGFQIFEGESLLRSKPVTDILKIENLKNLFGPGANEA